MQDFQCATSLLIPAEAGVTCSHSINCKFDTLSLRLSFDHATPLLIDSEGASYLFRPECKLEPHFSSKNDRGILESLTIHGSSGSKGNFSCSSQQTLLSAYLGLSRVFSHKGFNDYFKPIKRLGRGSFAAVYLVEHRATGIQKAAKVFSRQGQNIQARGREALENQIKTLRSVSHPSLLKFEGVYETENLIYVVTEYLSGGTLQEYMGRRGSLTGELVLGVLHDTLEGLKYLGAHNFLHRDIKPENIMLRKEDGRWVICDFGLTVTVDQDFLYDRCGTPGYIAPQILALAPGVSPSYTPACDLYSLGVIAHTLILGSLPFRVESQGFFDKKIISDPFRTPESLTIHPQILKFLRSLLEADPSIRTTAQSALKSKLFLDEDVRSSWEHFNTERLRERYERVLRMANIN